jgi:hypothetical protein
MFIDPDADPRTDPPTRVDERATVAAFLRWQRDTGNDPWRGAVSLRWVLLHMIEEYARHNGHADLLRQRIDGAVGQ